MPYTLAMGVGKGFGDLMADLDRVINFQATAFDHLPQGLTGDIFQHQDGLSVNDIHIVKTDNTRMVERVKQTGFAPQHGHFQGTGPGDFQGEVLLQDFIPDQVNITEATAAQPAQDFVFAEFFPQH